MTKRIFSYYGHKSRINHKIWEKFGDALAYIEPFGGSISTLLDRPEDHKHKHEVVGEVNYFLVNLFVAIKNDPEGVWKAAEFPTDENRLRLVDKWLSTNYETLQAKMNDDMTYWDIEAAGLWLYRQCGAMRAGNNPSAQIRSIGVFQSKDPVELLNKISQRLRKVKFLVGDWKRTIYRTCKDLRTNNTAILLDPPYHKSVRSKELYQIDDMTISQEVGEWAKMMGKKYKIALCGLEGEHKLPGWEVVEWKNYGGKNRDHERVWFSPKCNGKDLDENVSEASEDIED